MQGASDHGVSEALYLPDPDDNGIELYFDRPREVWPPPSPGFSVGMFTEPLDLENLLAAAPGQEPPRHADAGLTLGHVHLHVGDMADSMRFYRDVIGFDSMAELPGAAFVSAGGYHHHLGFNTWRGEGVPPAAARLGRAALLDAAAGRRGRAGGRARPDRRRRHRGGGASRGPAGARPVGHRGRAEGRRLGRCAESNPAVWLLCNRNPGLLRRELHRAVTNGGGEGGRLIWGT